MARRRVTKQETLQDLWDATGKLMEAEIVFRPFRGWYAEPQEPRNFYDEGEFLGTNAGLAMLTIAAIAK